MKRNFRKEVNKLMEDMAEAIYYSLPFSGQLQGMDLEVFTNEDDNSIIQIKWGKEIDSRLEYVSVNNLAYIVDHIVNESILKK